MLTWNEYLGIVFDKTPGSVLQVPSVFNSRLESLNADLATEDDDDEMRAAIELDDRGGLRFSQNLAAFEYILSLYYGADPNNPVPMSVVNKQMLNRLRLTGFQLRQMLLVTFNRNMSHAALATILCSIGKVPAGVLHSAIQASSKYKELHPDLGYRYLRGLYDSLPGKDHVKSDEAESIFNSFMSCYDPTAVYPLGYFMLDPTDRSDEVLRFLLPAIIKEAIVKEPGYSMRVVIEEYLPETGDEHIMFDRLLSCVIANIRHVDLPAEEKIACAKHILMTQLDKVRVYPGHLELLYSLCEDNDRAVLNLIFAVSSGQLPMSHFHITMQQCFYMYEQQGNLSDFWPYSISLTTLSEAEPQINISRHAIN